MRYRSANEISCSLNPVVPVLVRKRMRADARRHENPRQRTSLDRMRWERTEWLLRSGATLCIHHGLDSSGSTQRVRAPISARLSGTQPSIAATRRRKGIESAASDCSPRQALAREGKGRERGKRLQPADADKPMRDEETLSLSPSLPLSLSLPLPLSPSLSASRQAQRCRLTDARRGELPLLAKAPPHF